MKIAWVLSFLVVFSMPSMTLADFNYIAQMGANQGLISGGIAGDHNIASWAVTYGLTPSASASKVISQLNFKSGARIYDGDNVRFFVGPGLFINMSDETFFSLPDKYPDGYYPANAYFFSLQAALVFENGYFLEASMLDYYFEVLARNPRGSVSNAALISLGFGRGF